MPSTAIQGLLFVDLIFHRGGCWTKYFDCTWMKVYIIQTIAILFSTFFSQRHCSQPHIWLSPGTATIGGGGQLASPFCCTSTGPRRNTQWGKPKNEGKKRTPPRSVENCGRHNPAWLNWQICGAKCRKFLTRKSNGQCGRNSPARMGGAGGLKGQGESSELKSSGLKRSDGVQPDPGLDPAVKVGCKGLFFLSERHFIGAIWWLGRGG